MPLRPWFGFQSLACAGQPVCAVGGRSRSISTPRSTRGEPSGGDDLFAALCRARDEDGNQFTDDDVVNHMIFLMSAATDTSAAAATAALHQLALHPEWQDRVRAESSAEIGDGRLDLDALDRMQSLGMVINESMRLFAPVPTLFRKTLADTSIQGFFVPADTMVVVAPLFNHYWPGLWSDPHAFDPERFSDARREDRSHRLAFVPFGAGAHKCIGMRFATMVVKVLIHHLLRDHRIEMRPGYNLEWDMTALPAPIDDFPVLIRRVNDSYENVTVATELEVLPWKLPTFWHSTGWSRSTFTASKPACSQPMTWYSSTLATRKIRRWRCRSRNAMNPTGSTFSSITGWRPRPISADKRVIEVGCGHGGGASYLMRTLHPASYTGLDLNRAAIAFCRKRHNLLGVDFVHGDAEKLPFSDQSFDAVVNLESSAAYPHFPRFLAEVARVLSPGGHFLYADLRPRDSIAEWEMALAEAPMRMLSREDINAQVLCGLQRNSPRTLELVSRMPPGLHGVGREYSGMEGTRFFRAIQREKYLYRMYCFTKDSVSER